MNNGSENNIKKNQDPKSRIPTTGSPENDENGSTRLRDAVHGENTPPSASLSSFSAQDEKDPSSSSDIPNDGSNEEENSDASPSENRFFSGTVVGLIKGIVYIVSVIAIGVCLALFAVIPIANDVFAFVKEEKVVDITIPELATINDITEILHENGIISYPGIFKFYAAFTSDDGVFLEGDYSVSTTLNYSQLLDTFKPIVTSEVISITIPEGLTTDEIITLFTDAGIGTKEGFVSAINDYDWSEEYNYWFIDELMERGYSEDRFYRLDGYLYPDTYYFYTDSSEITVLSKLLDNFEAKFTETYRNYAEAHGFTVDEIIILASMIECEAKYLSEFSLVSSVFHNRLSNKSSYPYLESDATIMYAIFHETGERPERLTSTDYDTPYNTYDYKGLPPGAISNPGYNAITYALYPKSTNYFYFVANNDGYSVFSETLSQHNAAIKAVMDGTAVSTVLKGMTSSSEYDGDD